jgi:hypothetical protein
MILEFVDRMATHGIREAYFVLRPESESDVRALGDALEPLTRSTKGRLAVHDLPFTTRIADCQLHAASAAQDGGAMFRTGPRALTLVLCPETWEVARATLTRLAAGEIEYGVHLNPTEYGPRIVCTRAPGRGGQ